MGLYITILTDEKKVDIVETVGQNGQCGSNLYFKNERRNHSMKKNKKALVTGLILIPVSLIVIAYTVSKRSINALCLDADSDKISVMRF